MHPDPAFRTDDQAAMLDAAQAIGLAHIFVATPAGPMVVHAPLTRSGDVAMRFHISRANRACPYLDGAVVLAAVTSAQGYISPNWYAVPGDQVPTWNYVAVEIDGTLRQLDDHQLTAQLDSLAALHEPRVNPARPWTRAKMDDGVFRRMLHGIVGFELSITAVRGTTKLSQNKSSEDRNRVISALRASGNAPLAAAMTA